MSRVFLLSSNLSAEPHAAYPLGMALVASAAARRGHTVRQFDLLPSGGSLPSLTEAVRAFGPDVVGISLRNIDSCDSLAPGGGWHLAFVRDVVSTLRRCTSAPIVVGGPGFSIMPIEILDFLGADHGVAGEGERAFPDLVDALGNGTKPPRLVCAAEPLPAEEMLRPLWDDELVSYYVQTSGNVNYQTKRGCPHGCAYCTYPGLEGTRLRFREPGAVADDLERLKRDHKVEEVFFTDSVFNDGRGHYLRIAEELVRRDLNLRLCALIRPEGVGREEAALLKRAGLCAVEFGTDATTDVTLSELGKDFRFADVIDVNRVFADQQVPCAHFVMFGGPGETQETVRQGLANLNKLEKCVVFAFSGIRVLPSAPLYARAIREGLVSGEDPLLRPIHYFSPSVDPAAMNAAIEESFQGRRDRLFPPHVAEARLLVLRRFGFKGLLWDRLVSSGPEQPPRPGRATRGRRPDA